MGKRWPLAILHYHGPFRTRRRGLPYACSYGIMLATCTKAPRGQQQRTDVMEERMRRAVTRIFKSWMLLRFATVAILAACTSRGGGQAAGAAVATPASPPVRSFSTPPPMQIDVNKNYTATMETTKGTITIMLLPKVAPMTVNIFVFLARQRFYDGLKFHRVEPNFVIQGGDPQGTGVGGPGYHFQDEPVKQPYKAGTVAMANSGPNTNGSQFFICLADLPQLPPSYTIFGQTTSGMDVVKNIRVGDVIKKVMITEK